MKQNKRSRRILSLALSLLMFALYGCGSGGGSKIDDGKNGESVSESTGDTVKNTEESETETTESTVTETTAESESSDTEMKKTVFEDMSPEKTGTFPKAEIIVPEGKKLVLRSSELDRVPEGEKLATTKENFGGAKFGSDNEILYTSTASVSYKGTTGKGSYSVQFKADIRGENGATVQLFLNNASGHKHICISISGNFVRIGRPDYERGGASFTGDTKSYTFRAEVYPSGQLMRYYVNDVLLGEMNIADNDYPLNEDTTFGIAAVGDKIDVAVSDIVLAHLDDIEPRRYTDIDYKVGNENVYPKSAAAPAETIYLVDARSLNDDELLTLVTLQGIVNRTQPEIFVDYRKYNNDPRYSFVVNEKVYPEMLKSKGRTVEKATLEELLTKYADRFDGIVSGDAFGNNNYEENIITTLCGVLDSVYINKYEVEYSRKHIDGLSDKEVLIDVSGKFASSVDAYMWVWENYGNYCSKNVIFHMPTCSDSYSHPTLICRDYAVMSRAFVFCTDDVKNLSDYEFYMSLFASTATNTGIIGQGGGLYPEFEMFQICGQFGKYFTYGFSTPNMSLLNSLEVGELKQSEPEDISLTPDTVYVAYDMSEGDNLSWDYHLWMKEYDDSARRALVPKGYSICGAIYYVAPAILEYYYNNATSSDCFFLDGGGISNCSSPDDFAILYREEDREQIMERMFELTEYVAEKTDIHVLRALHNISDEMAMKYSEKCPSIIALLSSYGNTTYQIGGIGSDYKKATYMVGNIVRERCALSTFNAGLDTTLRNLYRKTKDDNGICFARVFVYANQVFDDLSLLDNFTKELEQTKKNIVVVRPDTFARLYKEWAASADNAE